ncbi:histidine phosphatase family protein, partial [Flavobacterium sp. LBUM151]
MALLIFVRHGQSLYNLENRFTGILDIPLTDLGKEQAKQAG